MGKTSKRRQQQCAPSAGSGLAKVLAPEDIRPGDLVTILHVVQELPSFFWREAAAPLPSHEPVRIPFLPEHGGVPLKVKSVCLPFVLVKTPSGAKRTLDVRQHQLARLDEPFATAAWKGHKRSRAGRLLLQDEASD
jgi:hypothetical protein